MRQGIRSVLLIAAIAFLFHCAARAEDGATVVRVVPVIDPRLSKLSAEQTSEVLSAAAIMIERSYGKLVKFELQAEEHLPKWFDDRWATISPYEIPAEYRADLFDEDLKRFDRAAFSACRAYGSVDQLRALLDEPRRANINGYPAAARALLEQYKDRRAKIRDMVLPDGSKLITPATRRLFSQATWEILLVTAPDVNEGELYLTNILLVDDFLADPAPHALASALAYGFMYPTTHRAVVTTLPTLHNGGALLPAEMRKLPEEKRHLAIAYIIAHEVGTHEIMGLADSYDADAGLARPTIAVKDVETIPDYRAWPATRVDLRELEPDQFRFGVLSKRLDVAIARKDRAEAQKVIAAAFAMKRLNREQLSDLMNRLNAEGW